MRFLVALAVPLLACRSDAPPPGVPQQPDRPAAAAEGEGAEEGGAAAGRDRLGDATRVVLRFQDSSVPPEYHRSHTITVTRTSIEKVVDSYGKEIARASAPLDEAGFARVIELVRQHRLRPAPATDDGGCTGGTGHRVEVTAGDEVLLRGRVYHCGGSDTGDLAGDVKGFAAALDRLAPAASDAPAGLIQEKPSSD